MDLESQGSTDGGTSRRKFLRNAGIAGGVAWAAPQIVNATAAHAVVSDPDCIVIDDFTVDQEDLVVSSGDTFDSTVAVGPATSILGGTRTTTLQLRNAGGSTSRLAIHPSPPDGPGFDYNNGGENTSLVTFSYNGDLSGTGKAFVKINFLDAGAGEDIDVIFNDGTGPQAKTLPDGFSGFVDFAVNAVGPSNVTLQINTDRAPGSTVQTGEEGGADTLGDCFQACPGNPSRP